MASVEGSSKAPDKGARKVSFDSMKYYQYDSTPANQGQGDGNRQWNRWNNGNRNRNDQSPQGNRDNNSDQNQGNNQQRDNTQGRPNRQTIVCTYPRCGLKGHKEDDCRCKADNLQNAAFKDSIIESVQNVVTKSIDDRLKELSFTTRLEL